MIRSYFGLTRNPFSQDHISLLPHQQAVFDRSLSDNLVKSRNVF